MSRFTALRVGVVCLSVVTALNAQPPRRPAFTERQAENYIKASTMLVTYYPDQKESVRKVLTDEKLNILADYEKGTFYGVKVRDEDAPRIKDLLNRIFLENEGVRWVNPNPRSERFRFRRCRMSTN